MADRLEHPLPPPTQEDVLAWLEREEKDRLEVAEAALDAEEALEEVEACLEVLMALVV